MFKKRQQQRDRNSLGMVEVKGQYFSLYPVTIMDYYLAGQLVAVAGLFCVIIKRGATQIMHENVALWRRGINAARS